MKTTQRRPTGSFIQPLDTCCCGLQLDTGVKIIIMIHSLTSFFFLYTCVSNILMEVPTIGNRVDLYTQSFNCAWALATIPFIASGISGISNHAELHLRMYLYWLMVTVAMDLVLTGVYLAKTMCATLPRFLVAEGSAFACGSMRAFGIVFIAMLFSFALYAIFVVWSRCEELQEGGSETNFDHLIGETRARERRSIFQHKSGLFGTGLAVPTPFPVMYGSMATPGIGGAGRFFSGTEHCTEFPPPVKPLLSQGAVVCNQNNGYM